MGYGLYWGDLHSHCAISYGHGTAEQALARAAQQLDFCSITGHAFWPDMPDDRARYGSIIDYHRQGFARLARNWPRLLELQASATFQGRFIALPSYEWHSMKYGDHNVYAAGPNLPLIDAPDLPGLRAVARQSDAVVIPHHIGYKAGYRGIDWSHFNADRSPFVEIFSLHGCSESTDAPYPMLHDMGPRDSGSTAAAGWAMGHRFGVIGSTDHHGAYPGSHGDGRLGVFAESLTRHGLWEALRARRVFAATGDRIDARLHVDDAWIGQAIRSPGRRRVAVRVLGSQAIDRVELLKNERIIGRFFPQQSAWNDTEGGRLRITWGWGPKTQAVNWNFELQLSDGRLSDVQTCFSGQAVVAPKSDDHDHAGGDEVDLPHAVLERGDRRLVWRSVTTGNLSMRHGTTQGLSLGIEAPLDARLTLRANGLEISHRLGELLRTASTAFLRGWLTEAVRLGPLTPLGDCRVQAAVQDEPELNCDYYRLRVVQTNNQWVWLTPIWTER
jgi:hypothetical protein